MLMINDLSPYTTPYKFLKVLTSLITKNLNPYINVNGAHLRLSAVRSPEYTVFFSKTLDLTRSRPLARSLRDLRPAKRDKFFSRLPKPLNISSPLPLLFKSQTGD